MTSPNNNNKAVKVTHRQYGVVGASETSPFDARSWPDGQHYVDILDQELGVATAAEELSSSSCTNTTAAASYWQAAARWALLHKFQVLGHDDERLKAIAYQKHEGKRKLPLSEDDIQAVDARWGVLVRSAQSAGSEGNTDLPPNLLEFFQTGRSNGRTLQWTVMDCPAGLQFQLHGHPNIELVHCFRGELHEVRMTGNPLHTPFQENDSSQTRGPILTSVSRPWSFNTLHDGEWIVNEVGSVHKTFTASKGEGCRLLVLWGGSHSNVAPGHEPTTPNVQHAVEQLDVKLCACGQGGDMMPETFLPESERRAVAS